MSFGGRWDLGDPEVDAFVDANVVSFAAWDVIVCLNGAPDSGWDLPKLCSVLARPETDLAPVLGCMVANGVLVDGADAQGCYSISNDPEVRWVVARFVMMASEREHRLEFVRRVLSSVAQR